MLKKTILSLIALILITGIGYSQTRKKSSNSKEAKIFYVNLFTDDVDVRLGEEDNYIFISNNIGSFTATYMLKTKEFGNYKLYFKKSSDDKYFYWSDNNKKPILNKVEAGKNYCILIDSDGIPHFWELTEKNDNGTNICFLNGTDSILTRMAIGSEWSDKEDPSDVLVTWIDNLDKDMISSFANVEGGDYSCFWQFPNQKKKNIWYYYPDDSGENPEVFNFENGKYYIFFAFTEGRKDYAKLVEITPQDWDSIFINKVINSF